MFIAELNSTNDYLKTHSNVEVIYTDFQTAGRGQVGNSWESERGQNVLLSVRLKHDQRMAQDQWSICEMASVALWQTVAPYVDHPELLTIKWPNDLYYGDNKLAGMLIEHTLCGQKLIESIVGIGLNVNQVHWKTSAPNPTSIRLIDGKETNVDTIIAQLTTNLHNVSLSSAKYTKLYWAHLYRKKGWFWWEERAVNTNPTMNGNKTDQSFEAQIKEITPQGELVLQTRIGEKKKYHFKQIKYILSI